MVLHMVANHGPSGLPGSIPGVGVVFLLLISIFSNLTPFHTKLTIIFKKFDKHNVSKSHNIEDISYKTLLSFIKYSFLIM